MTQISEILDSMQSKYKIREKVEGARELENSKATWSRIQAGDNFDELGFEDNHEKERFLKEWISENPYSNLT